MVLESKSVPCRDGQRVRTTGLKTESPLLKNIRSSLWSSQSERLYLIRVHNQPTYLRGAIKDRLVLKIT